MNDSAGHFGGGESLRSPQPARPESVVTRASKISGGGAAPVSRDPNHERFQRDDFHAGPLPPVLALGAEWERHRLGQLGKLRAGWQPAQLAGYQPAGGCHPAPRSRNTGEQRDENRGPFIPDPCRRCRAFRFGARVSGIGVARDDISSELLKARTRRMIQSQTFVIMREPQAVAGPRRILRRSLQALFRSASERSGCRRS